MQCCPLAGSDDGDAPSVYHMSQRTARKQHTCTECNEPIRAGSKYEHTSGCWDGSWSTYKTCLLCVEIRDHFACNGWLFGRLWEDLQENFFPNMRAGGPCMEGLSPEAKTRLFEKRLAWLGVDE
jgi:hypothetical protein